MHMTEAEILVRSILGPTHRKLRPFAECIEQVRHLLFVQNIHMDDIRFTKDVYAVVAQRLGETPVSVTRLVERVSNDCWAQMVSRGLVSRLIGHPRMEEPYPADLIGYLAFYLHFQEPFSLVASREPRRLF